jgi:hypothetical protein
VREREREREQVMSPDPSQATCQPSEVLPIKGKRHYPKRDRQQVTRERDSTGYQRERVNRLSERESQQVTRARETAGHEPRPIPGNLPALRGTNFH